VIKQLRSAPNQLTMLRLIFVPFIVNAVIDDHYGTALILFILAGISDGLDGVLARALKQRTRLGEYLDPIADKLLLSSLFFVLSIMHKIPWRVTVLVFSRDIGILVVAAVLYATTSLRDFRPSLFGKANTVTQIATLAVVLLAEVYPAAWIVSFRQAGLWLTFALTLISWLHYTLTLPHRMRANNARMTEGSPNKT
jgi:cardiolipin synthase (CMP-forming)